MAEMLNLDDFAKVTKIVNIKGEEHEVVEMTVETFIAATNESKKFESKDLENDSVAQIESAVRMLAYAIPTLSEERIRKLNFGQIKVLMAFVRGEIEKNTPTEVEAGNAVQE